MILWWNSLDLAQQIFGLVGIAGTVILIIQTIMLLFGFGDDGADGGVDDDFGDDMPDGDGLALFSIRGIVAMLAVMGWSGVVFLGIDGLNRGIAIALAVVCGFLTLVAMAYIMRAISKLQSSGNIDVENCIGKVGQVYIPVKASAQGQGKVNITVQGTYTEFSAITAHSETIPTGAYVRVVAVDESGVLVVEPIDKNTNNK